MMANENDIVEFGDTVKMTAEEFHKFVKLCQDFDMPAYAPKVMLDKLDNYKMQFGVKYKSDYRALRSWVVPWWFKEGSKLPVAPEDKIPLVLEANDG
jgi:hypothetical protein